jgi:uncharacterized RDD family membrane protein YckC
MELNLPARHTYVGPATLWKRTVSFLLDLMILDLFIFSAFRDIIISTVTTKGSFSETYSFLLSNPSLSKGLMYTVMLACMLALAYFVMLEYLLQQTVGKMLLDITVVSTRETSPERPGIAQCITRSIFVLPIVPFIVLWLIDPIFYLFNREQRFSEYISGTRVVEKFTM